MSKFNLTDALFLGTVGSIFLTGSFAVDAMDKRDAEYVPAEYVSVDGEGEADLALESVLEDELITKALLEQGYLREDVPLDYDLQAVLRAECEHYGIPYSLALGLIQVESRFQSDAVSTCGSYGLCQLNPKYFPGGLAPAENVITGIGYLAECIDRCGGDLEAALTVYNVGEDTGDRSYASTVLEAAQNWERGERRSLENVRR